MGAQLTCRGQDRQAIATEVLAAIREKGAIIHACKAVGIARQTWWEWTREDPALLKASQEALDWSLRDHLDNAQGVGHVLMERALAGDKEAELNYLTRYVAPVALRMAAARLPEYRKTIHVEGEITHKHELVSSVASDFLAGHRPEMIECESETIETEE